MYYYEMSTSKIHMYNGQRKQNGRAFMAMRDAISLQKKHSEQIYLLAFDS